MPRWLTEVLRRIHALAGSGAVRLTFKTETELVVLGLSLEDVREVLLGLRFSDSAGRLASETTGEWMYVFKPRFDGETVYIKILLRETCVVVSFHEEDAGSR